MVTRSFSIEDGNLQSRSIVTTRNKVYSDLDLTFARAPNDDVYKKTDAAAVKQSVKNILLTNRLEKPFNAYFGGDLNSFLFGLSEFYDEQTIEDEVRTVIENYEPRARLRGVRAKIIPDENDIRVTVAFQVVSTQEEITLEVSLARLR
jgi:phage baseplate assembly protein W